MPEKQKAEQQDGRAAEVYRTAAQIILQKGYDATSVGDPARNTACSADRIIGDASRCDGIASCVMT